MNRQDKQFFVFLQEHQMVYVFLEFSTRPLDKWPIPDGFFWDNQLCPRCRG